MLGMGDFVDEFGNIIYGGYGAGYDPTISSPTTGPYGSTGGAVSSTNIFDSIMAGINSSSKILSTRYGVPQLNPGQYIQTGPNGTSIQYQLAPGQTTGFPGLSTLTSGGSILPIALIGGVLLFAMMGRK